MQRRYPLPRAAVLEGRRAVIASSTPGASLPSPGAVRSDKLIARFIFRPEVAGEGIEVGYRPGTLLPGDSVYLFGGVARKPGVVDHFCLSPVAARRPGAGFDYRLCHPLSPSS